MRVFDLATVCAAYVALRDVNVSGDEEQPLSDVNALFGALVDQVCRTSRSDRGGGRSASASSSQGDGGVVLQLSDLQKRSKSNVARQLEKYCDIDFAAMLADAGEEVGDERENFMFEMIVIPPTFWKFCCILPGWGFGVCGIGIGNLRRLCRSAAWPPSATSLFAVTPVDSWEVVTRLAHPLPPRAVPL